MVVSDGLSLKNIDSDQINCEGVFILEAGLRRLVLDGQLVECKVEISEEGVQEIIQRLAERISEDYAGRDLILVTVLNGGKNCANDLYWAILSIGKVKTVKRDEIQVRGYDATRSTGALTWKRKLSDQIDYTGLDVVLVEDIVDTGFTIKHVVEQIKQWLEGKALSVKVVSFLDKPARRLAEYKGVEVDYVGHTLAGMEFVVGYGMDYNGEYRGIPEVCIVPGWVVLL